MIPKTLVDLPGVTRGETITDYHACLYAKELQRRCPSDSRDRLTSVFMDSEVDLNPHQIDAALFAFRSPLSKGAILADEVGLGKTIEAGIILSQKWAERKRRILVITPASLRKQWNEELWDKFHLPSRLIESVIFNRSIKEGNKNPFEIPDIVICSYTFAKNKAEFIRALDWDLVVIDEAHRLRNVYKTGNKIANELKNALRHCPKLLLTATPLQNSLLELFGLVSIIDEHVFGDLKSFRRQFARLTSDDDFNELKDRLGVVCKRTRRRQVVEYIRYTERRVHTQEFIPSEEEITLYDLVSEYLRRPNLQALPASQRSLMTLVLRKLLASSTFAIAGALDSLATKLEQRLVNDTNMYVIADNVTEDFEAYEEIHEESETTDEEQFLPLSEADKTSIRNEIEELRSCSGLAMEIAQNAKGESLLQALKTGLQMTADLGGSEKAVIFTESRRTQNYLFKLLTENGYTGEIVLFNGTNNDPVSREIYAEWKTRYSGTDKITGSRSADTRAALVEHFRKNAKILIATEAAAEGINLQFCSLVVNYDLPWNPQRIEQRIGRCHRYGQQHDVVVVNFLNKTNAADQRVYNLLSEKFRLFDGVFGASDEVLGSIESGVDFEKRIAEIYQACRTSEEIQASFDALQEELFSEINERLQETRQTLLENFDAEVSEKLRVYKVTTTESMNRYEALFWDTTKHVLDGAACFHDTSLTFRLDSAPRNDIPTGEYVLKHGNRTGRHYRLGSPLAQWVLNTATTCELPDAHMILDYSGCGKKISILEPIIGSSGILVAHRLTVSAFEEQDYILVVAVTSDGVELDIDQARRLMDLPATTTPTETISATVTEAPYTQHKNTILAEISERNAVFFEEEMDKLDGWAEDKRKSLKTALKDYDDQIAEFKKEARRARNMSEKLVIQKKIRELDKKRDVAWKKYDEDAHDIERQKDDLIDQVEARLHQEIEEETLFTLRWELV